MPVDTPIDEFNKYVEKWQRCRDAFDGADAVKEQRTKYLPMLGGTSENVSAEQKAAYDAYLFRATFLNAVAPTVVALTGAVFMKPMSFDKVSEPVMELTKDVTLTGQTIEQFARDMVGQVVHPGRYGVLVDMPEEASPKNRPYAVPYRAEQIVNWRTEIRDGEKVPVFIVLKESAYVPGDDEFTRKPEERYRVLRLTGDRYTQQLYRPNPNKKDDWIPGPVITPTRRGVPLPFIPFTCVGPEGVVFEISDPPLMALTDMNFSHYLTMADKEWAEHWTSIATPVITGVSDTTPVTIGATAAIKLADPNAKAFFMEFTGAGIGSLAASEKEKRMMMAALGGRLLDPTSAPATATEVVIRHAGEHASLLTIAMGCSQALSRIVQWFQWWISRDTDVNKDAVVTLATDFYPVKMTPDELSKLMLAWQANAISYETFFAALQDGGIYPPGTTMEDEKARIDAESEEAAQKALEIARAQGGNNENEEPPIPELDS